MGAVREHGYVPIFSLLPQGIKPLIHRREQWEHEKIGRGRDGRIEGGKELKFGEPGFILGFVLSEDLLMV